MKMNWYIFLIFLLVLSISPAALANEVEVAVVVDGERVEFDNAPVLENNLLLAPVREVFTAMGASVLWDDTTRTASAIMDNVQVDIPLGSYLPTVDGLPVVLDVPVKFINNRTYAPLRFAAEALGCEVVWDGSVETVFIATPAGSDEDKRKRGWDCHDKLNINGVGPQELAGINGISEEVAASIIERRDEVGGVFKTFEEIKAAFSADIYNILVDNIRIVYTEEGTGSWYGPKFHGNKTYYGEIFDMNLHTAAHPSLPFGTQVKVTYLETGKSVWVRINDRGPNQTIHPDRVIDLSRSAAESIGLRWIGPVELTIMKEK